MKAEGKKAETMTKLNKKKLQTTISEKLAELPSNRRKILELRIEKERIMDLKEVKQKMWRKWRQNKGKKIHYPRLEKGSTLEYEKSSQKLKKK